MNKIFIKTDENNSIISIHYKPFDENVGLHKSESDLLEMGFLINKDEFIDPEEIEDKHAIAYYTPEKGVYYEYVDIKKSNPYGIPDNLLEQIKADTADEIAKSAKDNELKS